MNKYGIEKIEGESAKDYERRYCAAKMRALRAVKYALRTEPPKQRVKNKAPGKNGNLTHEQWEELKIKVGETPEEHKRRYSREIMRLYRARMSADKKKEELEKSRIINARYGSSPRGKEIRKRWAIENSDRVAFYASNRRAAEIRATPLWVDYNEISKIYEKSYELTESTGILYHVDHYYPLRGKTVSGLHVHTNLRVISARENLTKLNKHPESIQPTGSDLPEPGSQPKE